MARLIQRFAQTIPRLQARFALQQLRKEADQGGVSNFEEVADRINSMLAGLSSDNPVPESIIPSAGTFQRLDLEDYNYRLRIIESNLRILYTEIDKVFAMLQAHEEIFETKTIADLTKTLEVVDQHFGQQLFLKKNAYGFTKGLVSYFSQGQDFQQPATNVGPSLFKDPKTQSIGQFTQDIK